MIDLVPATLFSKLKPGQVITIEVITKPRATPAVGEAFMHCMPTF
jgi:hypothetical protein